MKRRQRGFTFIEILVVMGIIVVLVGMVAVVVPRAQERQRQVQSINNVRNMVQLMAERALRKNTWPRFDGKNFVLSLVAFGDIDKRNPDNLKVFFSPGDQKYRFEDIGKDRYDEVKIQALKSHADFHELTSYAGRRNGEDEFRVTPDLESMGVPVIGDDDDGNLHHPKGMVLGYTSTAVKFVEWSDLEMTPPIEEAGETDPFIGDNASIDLLRGLSSE